jgi:hypothetical protein
MQRRELYILMGERRKATAQLMGVGGGVKLPTVHPLLLVGA